MSTTEHMSFSRRWLLRPPFPEHLTALELRNAATVRGLIFTTALVIDVLIYFYLRGDPAVRPGPLRAFAVINVFLLAIDLLLTAALLGRAAPGRRGVQVLCCVIEAFTIVVWVQVTGSISSYFISAGILFALLYRLFFDYGTALAGVVALIAFHAGAFGLEELGFLRAASLFAAEPTGVYDSASFRHSALLSILCCYGLTFVAGNIVVLKLREKDSALRAARERLLQLVNEAQLGRLSGRVLQGRYELNEVLGRGGMGEVYAARQLPGGERLAVKVLNAHLGDDPQAIARFRREVESARRLPPDTTAAVQVLGQSDDGYHFIAMELLEGEDLGASLRRRGRLPLTEVVALAQRVGHILDAAHAAGIVHRDLKPSNIFLVGAPGDPGHVRLLDFGLSRLRAPESEATLTGTEAVLGSPGYLAPEQALAQQERVGPATDVFALGAVLYRALTGESAFPARNITTALHEAVHWHPPPPSTMVAGVPDDVDDVFTLALAKEPEQRLGRGGELAAALETACRSALDGALRARARALRPDGPSADRTLTACD